jgi:integrase/recombinase XerD
MSTATLIPTEAVPTIALLTEFRRHLTLERGRSVHTVSAYMADLQRFAAWLESERIDPLALTREQASHYVDQLGGSASTVRRRVASLRALYRFLHLDEQIDFDPTDRLRSSAGPRTLPRVPSVEAIVRLLELPEGDSPRALRDRALLELIYACGLRASEATGLLLAGVDLDGRELRVIGKGDRERAVPIGRHALAALRAYLTARPALVKGNGSPHLFVSRRGVGLTRQGLYKIICGYTKRAGLPMSPHGLRHAFATHLLLGGCDLRVLQEMLGHRSINTTQGYCSLSIGELLDAYRDAHPRAIITARAER